MDGCAIVSLSPPGKSEGIENLYNILQKSTSSRRDFTLPLHTSNLKKLFSFPRGSCSNIKTTPEYSTTIGLGH